MTASMKKSRILAVEGRRQWYSVNGVTENALVIAIAGGSASGKTRVAEQIVERLKIPWVAILSQDSFYKALTPEQSKNAFNNEHDFDSPSSFDYNDLNQALSDLRECRAIEVPNYSFTLHQRTDQTSYLYGASVVIVEGIFCLHDPKTRDLCDLKIFVELDSDLMLARRLRRDIAERGRDAIGVLDQYLRFVKPSYEQYVLPTKSHADVILYGKNNDTSIDMVVSAIRQKLERTSSMRSELAKSIQPNRTIPDTLTVMELTPQLNGIHTILRDQTTSFDDFVFFADRLSTLLIERALTLLPCRAKRITTAGTNLVYDGQELDVESGQLVGVSIMRSGGTLEKGLRRVIRDVPIGSLLIQSDEEASLYHLSLPAAIKSRSSAKNAYVLLLDSQICTSSAAFMAIRILLDHGVQEERIIFVVFLVSRRGGIHALQLAFPKVRIVSSAVDDGLEESWQEGKKVFAIQPGLGSFGDRYFSPV